MVRRPEFVHAAAVVEWDDHGALAVRKRSQAVPLGAGLGAFVGGARGELLEFVARELAPGAFAMFVEAGETSITPLDAPMEAFGGRVVCEWWTGVAEDALDRRTTRNGQRARRSTEPTVSVRGRSTRSATRRA